MDFATHTVAGLVVGRTTAPTGRAPLLAGALAGVAPDADVVVWAAAGLDAYLEARGGLTHGVVAVLVGPALVAAIVAAALRGPFRSLWLVSAVAWATHLALDLLTARGITPFAPFSDVRVGLGWVYPLDLTLIGLLTLPLWVPQVIHAAPRRVAAVTGGLVLLWIGTCGALHARAEARFEATLAEAGITPQRIVVVPAAFLPLWWNGIGWDGEAWHLAAVRPHAPAVLRGPRFPNHEHPAVRVVSSSPAGARFLRIATAPVAEVRCRPDGYAVLLRDLLSADPWSGTAAPPEVFLVEVKQTGLSVREQYWATWLSGRDAPAAECAADISQNPAKTGH